MSTDAKVKLKWYRFIQIVILPVMILSGCYMLISYFTDLFGLNLSWTDHSLKNMIELGGADVFHLGAYFWPVIGVLAERLLSLVLAVYAWIGSFRFRKYGRTCWLALCVLGFAAACAVLWVFWEYGLNRGGIIQWSQYIAAQTGENINVSTALITAMRIILIIFGVIALLYTIANFVYFHKRRHLFKESEYYQEPYEDEEYSVETPDPVQTVTAKTQETADVNPVEPVMETAAPAQEEPQPVIEPEIMPESDPVPAEADENDELDQLLKDTEDSMKQLSAGKEEELSQSEPEVIPAEIQPVSEEAAIEQTPLIRVSPFADEEEEDPSLAATQILIPVDESAAQKEEINFCPDCGKRIPDPEMRYCIWCGRKIR